MNKGIITFMVSVGLIEFGIIVNIILNLLSKKNYIRATTGENFYYTSIILDVGFILMIISGIVIAFEIK